MTINKTIFDVENLVSFNEATLMEMLRNLIYVKKELEDGVKLLQHFNHDLDTEAKAELRSVAIQLTYVNKNVESLNIVLLMKEAQAFEHIIELEKIDKYMVCLN